MATPIDGVKKFSGPMFIVFALSKVLVGIGLGVVLYSYLASYGWAILIVGIVVSAICGIIATQKM